MLSKSVKWGVLPAKTDVWAGIMNCRVLSTIHSIVCGYGQIHGGAAGWASSGNSSEHLKPLLSYSLGLTADFVLAKYFSCIISFNTCNRLWGRHYYYPHFTEVETKAQKEWASSSSRAGDSDCSLSSQSSHPPHARRRVSGRGKMLSSQINGLLATQIVHFGGLGKSPSTVRPLIKKCLGLPRGSRRALKRI